MNISRISQGLLAAILLVSASSLVLAGNPVFTMKAPTLDPNPQFQVPSSLRTSTWRCPPV